MKVTRITITAELEIDNRYLDNKDSLVRDLIGQLVKIKSGIYENEAMGHVTSAAIISRQKTPRKEI